MRQILPELNLSSFLEFSKMNEAEQVQLLREKGIVIDEERENDQLTRLYYVNGFFVEETLRDNKTIEILPFRRGYKIDSYLEVKEVLASKFSY
ncbi:MAG: hypothetical protein K0S32_71 [Bacteroidetes bacterium]|nr:hypothetical protein [Bacteroidota bacterium]